MKGEMKHDIRKIEKADRKRGLQKGGHDEQIRRIPDGEPHHRGAVSGTHWHDGVML